MLLDHPLHTGSKFTAFNVRREVRIITCSRPAFSRALPPTPSSTRANSGRPTPPSQHRAAPQHDDVRKRRRLPPPRTCTARALHVLPRLLRLRPTAAVSMSSDADYEAFLNKANQDVGGGGGGSANMAAGGKKKVGTRAVTAEVPAGLARVDEFFVSDADEPFEPVSLAWGGGMPDEGQLAELIEHDGQVETISAKDFDPQGQYGNVVAAVKEAGSSEVGFFRVPHGSTRAEYYVVSLDKKGKRLVGMKALAVET
ncbi:hypothetical protein BDY21DRAFT_334977 [Lineolata rhizophorae]|uniref:Uncharacterized protein n=1 Tax=Lineolata rhizophorae TaxID=578093 RepID=A0A6A6P8N7_9PEZI|nr:hypothetical protein BDY21DRAFT_334977 [Lineolata rhizophorae]